MKCLLFACLCLSPVLLFSQSLPVTDGKVVYEDNASLPASKDQLYERAKNWFAKTFTDSLSTMESDDKTTGEIIGRGAALFAWHAAMWVNRTDQCLFLVKVNVEDNAFSIRIADLYVQDSSHVHGHKIEDYNADPKKGINKNLLPAVDAVIRQKLQLFKTAMRSGTNQ